MHFGVVLPQLPAGARVDRVGDAPRSGRIHHAVDDERCRFEAALRCGLELPGESELRDVLVVDLIERAEALLVVVAAVRQPILVARLGRSQCRIVHRRFLLRRHQRDPCEREGDEASGKPAGHIRSLCGGFYGNFCIARVVSPTNGSRGPRRRCRRAVGHAHRADARQRHRSQGPARHLLPGTLRRGGRQGGGDSGSRSVQASLRAGLTGVGERGPGTPRGAARRGRGIPA